MIGVEEDELCIESPELEFWESKFNKSALPMRTSEFVGPGKASEVVEFSPTSTGGESDLEGLVSTTSACSGDE